MSNICCSPCLPFVVLFLVILSVRGQHASPKMVNIVDFGAIGDHKTLNTVPIQHAILAALMNDMDVYVPRGVFVTGQVELYSGVHIMLDEGAELYASDDPRQYSCLSSITTDTGPCDYPLIFANNAEDVGMYGPGCINGGANDPPGHLVASYNATEQFITPLQFQFPNCTGYSCKPKLVVFKNTRHIILKDITLKNSALWTTTLAQASDVLIDNCTIYGDRRWPNNDGVDIMSSSNIIIKNSNISTGDDSIAIITHTSYACSNISVLHSHLASSSAAIKLAAYEENASGLVSNLRFDNIYVNDTNRGLCIDPRWGSGSIMNASFSNMYISTRFFSSPWWGSAEPIYVTSMSMSKNQTWRGDVKNFHFENITTMSEAGVVLYAEDRPLMNFTFKNISLHIHQFSNISRPSHDYRPAPPPAIYYAPTDGIFIQYATNITLEDVTIRYLPPKQSFWGVCLNVTSNVKDLNKEGLTCLAAS
eukprot:TRINITY_DN5386_c0_g1_i1.p1 TRINITY_DN5386_c0_g1~~TRINITY_DN5386_c0_g1_i1.p1  ORF type:complete len:485 (+),score=73.63 TRINITY_DN5386_c0_g1_i1:25-1455(+)